MLFLDLSLYTHPYESLQMAKPTCVSVAFHADFSNVPDITTGLKRSQTDGTLDQVSHREKMEQTFRVRGYPKPQADPAGKKRASPPLPEVGRKNFGQPLPTVHLQNFFFMTDGHPTFTPAFQPPGNLRYISCLICLVT